MLTLIHSQGLTFLEGRLYQHVLVGLGKTTNLTDYAQKSLTLEFPNMGCVGESFTPGKGDQRLGNQSPGSFVEKSDNFRAFWRWLRFFQFLLGGGPGEYNFFRLIASIS